MYNSRMAQKFEKMSVSFQPAINNCFAVRETNTAKKLAMARSKQIDGYQLERAQVMAKALAELWERGEVPEALKEIKSKAELFKLAACKLYRVSNGYHSYCVEDTPLAPVNSGPQGQAAWALLTAPSPEEKLKKELQLIEDNISRQKIEGFFPTPVDVLNLTKPYIKRAVTDKFCFCDPNGGSGAILDFIKSCYPKAEIATGEISSELRKLLELKGYKLSWSDFMEVPAQSDYDLIVMNPPFEKLQDSQHIQHAFNFLKPGGQLIAIMSPGAFFHTSTKAKKFLDWFEAVGGAIIEDIPSGAFKSSGTMVATKMILVERPA